MAQTAATFRSRLIAEPGGKMLPVPAIEMPPTALQLDNVLFAADTFRRANVEMFSAPGRVYGVHVCVFPHLHDPTPIFGLDIVSGPARVTGIFLDLSPVTEAPPAPRLRDVADADLFDGFSIYRDLPEWCEIFSPDALAVRPMDFDEVARAIDLAQVALEAALASSRRSSAYVDATAGQARYVAGQRRNEHTFRMLTGFIGAGPARRFIDEVLFPM
jgi:phycocyanobilin:ferredoxin oxidoreductase